jgi:hypothetical protein
MANYVDSRSSRYRGDITLKATAAAAAAAAAALVINCVVPMHDTCCSTAGWQLDQGHCCIADMQWSAFYWPLKRQLFSASSSSTARRVHVQQGRSSSEQSSAAAGQ